MIDNIVMKLNTLTKKQVKIRFKIKNPPPVELCWQKKNPLNKLHLFALAQNSVKI
jgi:hypothetical protein